MTPTVGRAAFGCIVGVVLLSPPAGDGRPERQPQADAAQRVELAPIPKINDPVASDEVVERVYEFVARHENIVKYVPCFCGCEKLKHESVESCFIISRSPDGQVKWSRHGAGCPLCIDVVEAARELHEQGHAVHDIRRLLVERFYKTRITPTPEVPHQHGS